MVEAGDDRRRFAYPLTLVGQEGGPVHEQRSGVRYAVTQPVEDGEAVGVDVAPVVQPAIGQPVERLDGGHRVPTAEERDRVRYGRERQVRDLVLDDVHLSVPRWGRRQ